MPVEAPKKSSKKKSSSASKDVKKKKTKRSSSSKEAPAPSSNSSAPSAAAVPPPATPVIDPDAIQLFRRYDRARVGRLSRQDFLELLREYAQSDGQSTTSDPRDRHRQRHRMPLALTDAPGIPLGFARTEKNSEFEAGQLFERYDNDHTGTLTLDKFHVFFADFKPQLSAFVDDLQYAVAVAPSHPVPQPSAESPPTETAPQAIQPTASEKKSEIKPKEEPKSVRSEYHAALWKLRQICKTELVQQRTRLLELMQDIRDEMSGHQQTRSVPDDRKSSKSSKSCAVESSDWRFLESSNGFPWRSDDHRRKQRVVLYKELEENLEQIEEMLQWVRGHLARGSNISESAMKEFVAQAGEMQAHAQELAMKEFPSPQRAKRRGNQTREKSNTPKQSNRSDSDDEELSSDEESTKRERSHANKSKSRELELERLVAVKDQMIYQLLHERSSLRKEKASVESSLQQLSDVSTQEMKKWARLTDDMQAEIEHLRGQLTQQRLSSPMY